MRRTAASVLTSVLALLPPRPGQACSCFLPPTVLSPRDTQVDVPLNAIVVVRSLAGVDVEVSMRTMAGDPVAVTIETSDRPTTAGRTIILRPTSLLMPGTTYLIDALTGSEPTTTSFTTGTAIDDTPPEFAGLEGLGLETQPYPVADETGSMCVGSCTSAADGHVDRLRLSFFAPDDTAWVRAELRGGDTVDVITLDPTERFLESFACAVRAPFLDPGVEYCASVAVVDVAGHESGADVEICAEPEGCQGVVGCEPGSMCLPPVEEPPGVDPAGQSGCGCAVGHRAPAGWIVVLITAALCRRRRARHPSSSPSGLSR